MLRNKFNQLLLAAIASLYGMSAYALPSLQLGCGADEASQAACYDDSTTTSTISGSDGSLDLYAYANCNKRTQRGSGCKKSGKYAWDSEGSMDSSGNLLQYAYLIVAFSGDGGDVSVSNDGNMLDMVASGYGNPLPESPIAGHGVYDTYFEIFEFHFDGPIETIFDQQYGSNGPDGGSGNGFKELLKIITDVGGLHFDLITLTDGGRYSDGDYDMLNAFAPWSHDARTGVPEPGILALLGIGLAGMGFIRRKKP